MLGYLLLEVCSSSESTEWCPYSGVCGLFPFDLEHDRLWWDLPRSHRRGVCVWGSDLPQGSLSAPFQGDFIPFSFPCQPWTPTRTSPPATCSYLKCLPRCVSSLLAGGIFLWLAASGFLVLLICCSMWKGEFPVGTTSGCFYPHPFPLLLPFGAAAFRCSMALADLGQLWSVQHVPEREESIRSEMETSLTFSVAQLLTGGRPGPLRQGQRVALTAFSLGHFVSGSRVRALNLESIPGTALPLANSDTRLSFSISLKNVVMSFPCLSDIIILVLKDCKCLGGC